MGDERYRMHRLDRRLLDRGANGLEVPVGARVGDGDEPARAERAERELEETLGDDRVRTRSPRTRRRSRAGRRSRR